MEAWMRRLEGLKARSIPRKSIPEFDGEGDAYWWLICIEKHFEATGTQKNEELMEAVKGLRNGALRWWQCWRRRHPKASWGKFTVALLWRYKPEDRDVLPTPDDEEDELEERSKRLTVQRSLDLRQQRTDQQRKEDEDLKLRDDGSKFNISTTSAIASEQGPLHRPTTTATTPKPPEPLDGNNRVGAVANREEEKEQERDICHPDRRCRPKLQDNSVGWGKLNSTPWVKKGSTTKKKKRWAEMDSQHLGQFRDLMGQAQAKRIKELGQSVAKMNQAHICLRFFKSNRIGLELLFAVGYSQLLSKISVKLTKADQIGSKRHSNGSKLGSLSFKQWDPGIITLRTR